VAYKLRLLQHVRDELSDDVVVVVEDTRNLVRNPLLDHRLIDLLHVHLAVELGRELGRPQQLFVDIGDECGRHVAGLRVSVSSTLLRGQAKKQRKAVAVVSEW
jgi:hypothetical protein